MNYVLIPSAPAARVKDGQAHKTRLTNCIQFIETTWDRFHKAQEINCSDRHCLRPRLPARPGPQCVHIVQRKVVLYKMKPERARLG